MKRPKKHPTVRRHYTLLHELLASPTEPLPAAHQMHQLTRMWLGLAALETAAAPCTDESAASLCSRYSERRESQTRSTWLELRYRTANGTCGCETARPQVPVE